ncbi:MAG: HlyD family efflux transporter periplasmic adaptor subunit [Pyrinomonadaceae bacterium]|nr:HlyD family efflux transporter periplasmic adaptor subunit [Pyrinomonadaceae bacterium]
MALSRKKKFIIGGSVLALLVLIIAASILASRKDLPEVTTVTVKKRPDLTSTVTAPGEIRPIQFMNLTSEVQGRIEEIYVKEGDIVEQGQQLVRLDPNQLQSSTDAQVAAYQASRDDVQSARSQVTAAQNQLSQAQQSQIASDAAVSTSLQQVSTAKESVNQARQQAVTAQTEVDRNKVELNAANRELKRNEELLESGVVSRLEYDQAKDRVATAQANLDNARARLKSQNIAVREAQNRVKEAEARVREARARAKQQQVAVRDARRGVTTARYGASSSESRANQQAAVLRGSRNQRDKTLQIAPISGVIAEIPSKVGTFAVASLSSTPLLTIADMSTVNVEVKVDETEIDKVAVGQPAIVKVDAFGEQEIEGEVTQKTPLAVGKSQTSGGLSTNINVQEAKEFRVVIELKSVPDDVRNGLRPGMSATAVVTTDKKKDVLAVPIQAVIEKKPDEKKDDEKQEGEIKGDSPKPEGDSDKDKTVKGVFILDGNKVKFLEVTTGITGESDIQITSGIEDGQEVITGPSRVLNKLKEGDQVKKKEKKDGDEAR